MRLLSWLAMRKYLSKIIFCSMSDKINYVKKQSHKFWPFIKYGQMILFNKVGPFFNLLYLLNGMSVIIYNSDMHYFYFCVIFFFFLWSYGENKKYAAPIFRSLQNEINGICLKMFHFHFNFSTSHTCPLCHFAIILEHVYIDWHKAILWIGNKSPKTHKYRQYWNRHHVIMKWFNILDLNGSRNL